MNVNAMMIPSGFEIDAGSLSEKALDPEAFKGAFRRHPAGVAVVTADAGHGPVGLTATSVFSISADPPLLVFSVSTLSSSHSTITRARSVVVHLLDSEQLDLAELCATSGIDRFADTAIWSRLETGEPYFVAASSWIRGEVSTTLRAGSSTLVVVNATQAGSASDAGIPANRPSTPLVYHDRAWHALGDHSRLG